MFQLLIFRAVRTVSFWEGKLISNFSTARVASGTRDQTHWSIAFAHLKPDRKRGRGRYTRNARYQKCDVKTNIRTTLPETNSSHLKMDGRNISFLLWRPIFRGYVSFRECITYIHVCKTWTWTANIWNNVAIYIYISKWKWCGQIDINHLERAFPSCWVSPSKPLLVGLMRTVPPLAPNIQWEPKQKSTRKCIEWLSCYTRRP